MTYERIESTKDSIEQATRKGYQYLFSYSRNGNLYALVGNTHEEWLHNVNSILASEGHEKQYSEDSDQYVGSPIEDYEFLLS